MFVTGEQHELLDVAENDRLSEQELVVKLTRWTVWRRSLSAPIGGNQVCASTPLCKNN